MFEANTWIFTNEDAYGNVESFFFFFLSSFSFFLFFFKQDLTNGKGEKERERLSNEALKMFNKNVLINEKERETVN